MRKKIIMIVFALLGLGGGYTFLPYLWQLGGIYQPVLNNPLTDMLIGLVVMGLMMLVFGNLVDRMLARIEKRLTQQNPAAIAAISLSVIVGMLIAALVSSLFSHSHLFFLNTVLPVILMLLFGYAGYVFGRNKFGDLDPTFFKRLMHRERPAGDVLERKVDDYFHKYKLLDTNILIDGRIYDLVKTGFIEGVLVVPNFVLYELQYIADAGDSIKRVRGRRGLDILNKLRKENDVPVKMYEGDFPDIQEVDSKLIKLAKMMDAVIVTNDYNLNKVCEFQNVEVLNINALAKALKPRVIPGEKLNVMVIKNGTERHQGVAYLDDGTMIVVEDGRYYMNKTIEVEVTSALQTDAGRMIFAKPTHSKRELREKN